MANGRSCMRVSLSSGPMPPRERYAPGYGPRVRAMLDGRSAAASTGFLLPLLRPGMRLLDVGCGAGAITGGLVDRVADVVGVDASEAELERARERAPAATFVPAGAEAL